LRETFSASPEPVNMVTTPHKTSVKIEQVVDQLNAQWDLRLTRLHGAEAESTAHKSIGAKCFRRIRYLCWKTSFIDRALDDFQEKAKQIHSQWVFKPSQEKGTLPVLPVQKSLVARDTQSRRPFGTLTYSDSQRSQLLKCLYQILKEQSEQSDLSEMSESYSTTSFATAPSQPPTTPTTRRVIKESYSTTSHRVLKVSESVEADLDEPHIKDTRSSKRSISSADRSSKRHQTKLSKFFVPKDPPQPAAGPSSDKIPQTSFETIPSVNVSAVFSDIDTQADTSVATSLMSSPTAQPAEESQDLLPTQDLTTFLDDDDFCRSFNEACGSHSTNALESINLRLKTPFKKKARLPSHLPFWYCWEIHRIASELNILPIDAYRQITKYNEKSPNHTYDTLWTAVKQIYLDRKTALPQKSGLPIWLETQDKYEYGNKIVNFTVTLNWEEDFSRAVFNRPRLNPIQLEKSCRFHRRYGADRFLILSIPMPYEADRMPELRRLNKDGPPSRAITDFFAQETHHIAGRCWRLINAEEETSKKKKANKDEPKRLKVILFAESGHGITEAINVVDLLNWHMPLHANRGSKDLKLFSRISLGFSKTTSTIVLEPHEFLYRRDPINGPVMDDGCALMSEPLARAVWEAYGGEGPLPSVVQGRISGAKGLWLVDWHGKFSGISDRGFWIEVSDSQLKIKPHPRDRADADSFQRTFEVLKYWGGCREGFLNNQLITILENGGVPYGLLRETLENDLTSFGASLFEAMEHGSDKLRLWMHENGVLPSRSNDLIGSFPADARGQMKQLCESGFDPRQCEKLWENAAELLKLHVLNYVDKMRIRLPNSTVVFCAPDPCGVLEENEVYLGFSKPVVDPRTGQPELALEDIDVLLARNPAYLASDIQLRRAVYKHELRRYKNVILFSTKGQVATAALLSGGDYDGDTVICIWDPRFTQQFRCVDMPKLPSEEECGLQNRSRRLADVIGDEPTAAEINDFLSGCLTFIARPNLLGQASTEHERLVYSLSQDQRTANKLATPGTIKLAALAGYLVDANKQGWDMTHKAWTKLRREASGEKQLAEPAYKSEAPSMSNPRSNIIDYLKLDVAASLSDSIKGVFSRKRSEIGTYDADLSKVWRDALNELEQEKGTGSPRRIGHNLRSGSSRKVLLADLLKGKEGLHGQILRIQEMWRNTATPSSVSSPAGDVRVNDDFKNRIRDLYDAYNAITPPPLNHELYRQYQRETSLNHPTYWSLLKASCLYTVVRGTAPLPGWAWYIAGRELCILKTYAVDGMPKVMTSGQHQLTKFDKKTAKAMLERAEEVPLAIGYVDEVDEVDNDNGDDDDDTVALD
jgi:hypothetical protein